MGFAAGKAVGIIRLASVYGQISEYVNGFGCSEVTTIQFNYIDPLPARWS